MSDREFLEKLKNSDIVAMAELHNEKEVALPGYKLLKQKIRKKVHKGPKISGGLAIFVKNYLHKFVHVIPNTNDDSIWIKFRQQPNNKDDFLLALTILAQGINPIKAKYIFSKF